MTQPNRSIVEELKFVQSGVVGTHNGIQYESMLLMVRNQHGQEFASVYRDQHGWRVLLSAPTSYDTAELTWEMFTQMYFKMAAFVFYECEILLKEARDDLRSSNSDGESTSDAGV